MNMRRGSPGTISVLAGVCWLLLGLVLTAPVSYGQTAIWPKFRSDLRNTGRSPSTGPDNPGVTWQFGTGGTVLSSAAIGADGVSYVGSFDGGLYALNPDGTQRWRFNAGAPIVSSPAIDDEGLIYFGADNGILYVLDASGALVWQFNADGAIQSSPAPFQGVAYFGTQAGTVYTSSYSSSLRFSTA